MREEFSTFFPLCTHELALSTRPGAEAREQLTLREKPAYTGIRTLDLTSSKFRGYQQDHWGDRHVSFASCGDVWLKRFPTYVVCRYARRPERTLAENSSPWHVPSIPKSGTFPQCTELV
ncbi:unnamed protein product [Ectocarpus sp. 4 AP-2014]